MDIYQREGGPPSSATLPYVPGAEGAGTVAAVGPGVSDFAVGDRVAWTQVPGSYAEQAGARRARRSRAGGRGGLSVAAAVMLQGMTAHYLCHSTYPVAQGDTVVVHAAAGGVGLLLTQMIAMRGGVGIATTSTPDKAALARQRRGLRHGLRGLRRGGPAGHHGAGVAAVYDGIGQATFEASLSAVRPRGYMVLYGAASGPVPPFDLQRLARRAACSSPGRRWAITWPAGGAAVAGG